MELKGRLSVSGFPWQTKSESKTLGAGALASNILCKRHNEALSPLDSAAIRFYSTLEKIHTDALSRNMGERLNVFLFNGKTLERWMLKTICGMVFSGNTAAEYGTFTNWQPPLAWLSILFEDSPLPVRMGMYYSGKFNQAESTADQIEFTPLTTGGRQMDGASVKIRYMRFVLAMSTPIPDKSEYFIGATYRPASFDIKAKNGRSIISLWWSDPGDNKSVEIEYGK